MTSFGLRNVNLNRRRGFPTTVMRAIQFDCRRAIQLCTSLIFLFQTLSQAQNTGLDGFEFFEKQIRPLLVENCYECHSAGSESVKNGLYLDTAEGLLAGGDSGPAIISGNPDGSLLMKAVRYTDEDLQMPPMNKKLSAAQISNLEAWIKMGAPDPRSDPIQTVSTEASNEKHWAFQAVTLPEVPTVKNEGWIRTGIDAFILEKLEANEISPSKPADKRALIRRVSYDLTGLPPSPQNVSAFLSDDSAEAFSRVVERLLASPRYGERWARHWLDVARYADTKGYVFTEERRFPYSYTYRDYVIRAFNNDLPFDRFVLEQIAADRLPLGDDKKPLAALGYLTLGRRFLNNQHDIIDDRIDVVTRGMMGLTVACARCHDHKYDPIPSEDYYSLYGVFANSTEPSEKPLLGENVSAILHKEYLAERNKRSEELETFREGKEKETQARIRQQTGEYLLAAFDAFQLTDKSKTEAMVRERKLHPMTAQKWVAKLEKWKEESEHPIFGPWFDFSELSEDEFEEESKKVLVRWIASTDSGQRLNPMIALGLSGKTPNSMKEVCEHYGTVFAAADSLWSTKLEAHELLNAQEKEKAGKPVRFANENLEELRQILYGSDSPANVSAGGFRRLFDVPTIQKLRALKRNLDGLDATHPGAPPRAMALVDKKTLSGQRVFVRGNPNNQGNEIPRRFLSLLAGPNRESFEHGSGRLELAQAIASRDNPLTARVFVNRVWMRFFGNGLVRTPSDFGVRCELPKHAELLDYLAWTFMNDGWSIKNLHRLILNSSVYQQASEDNRSYSIIDPNNELLWRMSRRRLDFEALRDTLLTAGGRIDFKMGGHAVDLTDQPFTMRRSVYGFIERQNLPSLFRTFDFASPDTTNPRRFNTTVPQQALFMINSPFAVQQARQFASLSTNGDDSSSEERIRYLYKLAYQRDPESEEIEAAFQFLEKVQAQRQARNEETEHLTPWEKLTQVLLMANELVFVD